MARKPRPLSATTLNTLRTKAKGSKLFNLRDLTAVYRRGQGAFLSSGARPGQTMASWAMARVNSILRGSKKQASHRKSKSVIRSKQSSKYRNG